MGVATHGPAKSWLTTLSSAEWRFEKTQYVTYGMIPVRTVRADHGAIALIAGVALLTISIIWGYAGRRARGAGAIRWFTVPTILGIAYLCVVGPGRWFPKHPFEGATIIEISRHSGITMLDLLGLALAVTALLLGGMTVKRHDHQLDAIAHRTGSSPEKSAR